MCDLPVPNPDYVDHDHVNGRCGGYCASTAMAAVARFATSRTPSRRGRLPEGTTVALGFDPAGRLPALFSTTGTSSFSDFLTAAAPELLPGRRPLPPAMIGDAVPHATTIVALSCANGVVMAGDRRATM